MANVKLNRKLNLVLSAGSEDDTIYIHSTPISRAVFEDNFLVISRAFTAVYTNGLGPVTGPRVAALLLAAAALTKIQGEHGTWTPGNPLWQRFTG